MLKQSFRTSRSVVVAATLLAPAWAYGQIHINEYFPMTSNLQWWYSGSSTENIFQNPSGPIACRFTEVVNTTENSGEVATFEHRIKSHCPQFIGESATQHTYSNTAAGVSFLDGPPAGCTEVQGDPPYTFLPAYLDAGYSGSVTVYCPQPLGVTRRVDLTMEVMGIQPAPAPIAQYISALRINIRLVTTNIVNGVSGVVSRTEGERWYGNGVGELLYRQTTYGDGMTATFERKLGKLSKDDGDNCCSIGDPINYSSGNHFQVEDDIPGFGNRSLAFQRYYNSRSGVPTDLGSNWKHTYSANLQMLSISSGRMAMMYRPNGKTYTFRQTNSGWISDADVTDRLSITLDANGNMAGAVYVTGDSRTETYDAYGRLTSIYDRNGYVRNLTYVTATSPQISAVTDAFGRALTFSYDATGRIADIADPQSNKTSFAYDSVDRLVKVTYPGLSFRTYGYDEASLMGGTSIPEALTSINDENGNRYAYWQFDSAGRAVFSANGSGVATATVSYGANGARTVTDGLGTSRNLSVTEILGVSKTTELSSPCPGCSDGGTASKAYDAQGNILQRADFNGNFTTYQYDTERNVLTSKIEAAGKPESRTTSLQWHSYWRLPVRTAGPKKIVSFAYNGDDGVYCAPTNATIPNLMSGSQAVPVLCKKVEQATTDATGVSGFAAPVTGSPRTWTWTYSRYGQVLTADGPRTDVNDVTTYTYYDAADADLGKRGNLATITDALGHVTQFTSYDANGRVTGMLDLNGVATSFTYDLRGRLTGKTVGSESTTYTYDPVGQLTQVSLPDGTSLTYTYDPAHRLTAITDGQGNKIQYTLDAMGNRTKDEVLDPNGSLAQTRSRVYDALNRLYQDIGAQNQTTTYAYDANGNRTGITDPLNRTTVQGFDALDRLIQITDPGTGQTRFAYDGQDRLTQVTDPRNLVTGYTLDGLGNRTGQQSPDTGSTAQSFDAAGNLTSRTDAKNQTTQYQYDALNRLTQVTLADGARQTYTWDTGTNGIGRLAQIAELNSASQETGRTEYGYDAQGRIVRETRTIGGLPYVTLYGYANGRLTSLTYPSGRLVEYGYDSIGRVSQISTTPAGGSTQTIVSNVTYQPFGTVKSFTYGNGQTYSRSIDQDGRIASYTLAGQTQAVGYDDASRISFISDAGNPVNSVNYGYDVLDRLTSATLPSTSYGYGYDATGNRTSQTVGAASIPYTVNAASNQIQSIGSSPPRSYSHDANGSVTNDGNNQYGYDVRGRLNQTITAQGSTGYEVNAQGERVRKTGPNGDRLYHYDRQGRLIAEGGAQGQIDREYLYLHDLPVAVIVQ